MCWVVEDVVITLLSLTAVLQVPKDSSVSVPDEAFLSVQRLCRRLVTYGAEDVLFACRPLDFLCLTIARDDGTIHVLCFLSKTMHDRHTSTCVVSYAAQHAACNRYNKCTAEIEHFFRDLGMFQRGTVDTNGSSSQAVYLTSPVNAMRSVKGC